VGFDRIIGQEILKTRMASEVMSKRGNTYIVSGPEGSGKTLIAEELAKGFLCQSPTKEGACGKCRCCIYSDNNTNPDLVRVEPEKEGAVISVDRIRELVVGDYETAPRFSPNKVYLINGNYLGKESQNALLKSIEEPPSDVVFIFEVTNSDTLLPTIRSRAAEYKIRRYRTEEVKKILALAGKDADDAELSVMTDFADGIPGRALKLADDESFAQLKADIMDLILGLCGSSVTETLKRADEVFGEYRDRYLEPVILMIWLLGDLMRLVSDIDCESIRFEGDRTRLEKFVVANAGITQKEIGRALEYIGTFVADRKVNVSYDGTVAVMMLKIHKEFNK